MKILLSPAKKLDFSYEKSSLKNTDYLFSEQSKEIMKELSNYSVLQLSKLMKISDKLSILNKDRNDSWTYPFSVEDSKQALFAFKGEVYQNIRVNEFSESELDLANESIRIISGLYGLLSPSDLILPYRLEMGTKFSVSGHKNLYSFWKDILTKHLLSELKSENFLVNLASDEYFKVFDSNEITVPIVTPIFKDIKNKSKGYKIQKGEHNIVITHKNTKKMNSEKVSLMNVISKLREDDMSYGDISDHLNKNGLKTIRGGKWSRQSVRRFFDYGSKDLTLVEIENDKIQKKK